MLMFYYLLHVLVSHDERLINLVADELWVVHKGRDGNPGRVEVFDGTFEQYKDRLRTEFEEKNLVQHKKRIIQ